MVIGSVLVLLKPIKQNYHNFRVEGTNLLRDFRTSQKVTKEKVERVVSRLLDFIASLRILSGIVTLGFYVFWKITPLVSFPFFIGCIFSAVITYDMVQIERAIGKRSWEWRSSQQCALPKDCIDRISESAFYMRKSMLLLWPLLTVEINYLPSFLGLIKEEEGDDTARRNSFIRKVFHYLR